LPVPHRRPLRFALVAATALTATSLSGCIALVAGAGGAAAGYSLGQERSPADQARDIGIRSAASHSWAQYNYQLSRDVDATVYDGRVLLTGRVPSEEWRQEAVKRTWQVKGVKEVYDEIQVGPDSGFWQDASDTEITARLKASLIADGYVKSINYTITTVGGTVYIIGSARSQAELNRVVDHARNTPNVKRVVSYVRIRPGEPPRAMPSGGAAPGNAPPPNAAPASSPPAASAPAPMPSNGATPDNAPTPRQSIEVQPLK
jgi:osmotically-inducible protein OsmY